MLFSKKTTVEKRTDRKVLPEVMEMSYVDFVSRQYEQATTPIMQELKKLEQKHYELQDLYAKAIKENSTRTAAEVSEARVENKRRIEEKRKELIKAQQENAIDLTAKAIARKLDSAEQAEQLNAICLQLENDLARVHSLMAKANAMAVSFGIDNYSLSQSLTQLYHFIIPNIQAERGKISSYLNREALLDELDNRLAVLEAERIKERAIRDAINK